MTLQPYRKASTERETRTVLKRSRGNNRFAHFGVSIGLVCLVLAAVQHPEQFLKSGIRRRALAVKDPTEYFKDQSEEYYQKFQYGRRLERSNRRDVEASDLRLSRDVDSAQAPPLTPDVNNGKTSGLLLTTDVDGTQAPSQTPVINSTTSGGLQWFTATNPLLTPDVNGTQAPSQNPDVNSTEAGKGSDFSLLGGEDAPVEAYTEPPSLTPRMEAYTKPPSLTPPIVDYVDYIGIPNESRPNVFAFYVKRQRNLEENDDSLIKSWRQSWQLAGYNPRVLTVEDAAQHSQFGQYSGAIDAILATSSVHKPGELKSCYLRYLAMNVVGGGMMVDLDTHPKNLAMEANVTIPDKLTSYCNFDTPDPKDNWVKQVETQNGLPCAVVASSAEWLRVGKLMGWVAKLHMDQRVWTDAHALQFLANYDEVNFVKQEVAQSWRTSGWDRCHVRYV